MTMAARWGMTPLCALLLAACAAPPRAPLDAQSTRDAFAARRLESSLPELPPPATGWTQAQWLAAALKLNPQLAEQRAAVAAAAAAQRSAGQLPNPNMQLFAEYLTAAAQSAAWLYGVSLDFLLREPGARSRARQQAALQSALAESELSDAIWQVRAALRLALLDAVAARDESVELDALVSARQALLRSDRTRLQLGDLARPQLLSDELELARAEQRRRELSARQADAVARLAAAVGVPAAALSGVPLRWDDWAAIGSLTASGAQRWRDEALIGRTQIVHALREYDLAELALRAEVAKRWPQLHLTPAYAWGGGGVREVDTFSSIESESAVSVSFELPLFNQHQGEIGEALARRTAAGEHLKSVQAQIFSQIDRAEAAWPAAHQGWTDSQHLAELSARTLQSQQQALAAGAQERAAVVTAQIAATEAQLTQLEAAYSAQLAFGSLEDAYRRPLTEEARPSIAPGQPQS